MISTSARFGSIPKTDISAILSDVASSKVGSTVVFMAIATINGIAPIVFAAAKAAIKIPGISTSYSFL